MPTKEQRRLARERNHFVWSLMWDGRERQPPSGRIDIDGPLPPECQEELAALVRRWTEEGRI